MKKVNSILSIRCTKPKSRSWDIVFEWEDILSNKLNIPIKDKKKSYISYLLQKLGVYEFINKRCRKDNLAIQFVSDIKPKFGAFMDCNTIPIIIDFWMVEDEEIKSFIKYFRNVPLLLVSNLEVVNVLKRYDCPFPVEHFPLSLPDKYSLENRNINENKIYEFGFIGRVDKYFKELLEKYSERHPDFEYVFSEGVTYDREYWTNKGKSLGKDKGRESYIEYLKKTKITCYSTPGMDKSKKETVRYNQVTPRVLEMLANGCQVIGHYPMSDDVLWYNLASVVPVANSYEQFEQLLDGMRKTSFDYDNVGSFLEQHYTSRRAVLLEELLKKHLLL